MQNKIFVYSINTNRMKNWINEFRIYQRGQLLTEEIAKLCEKFKEQIKNWNTLELEVALEEIYREEEKIYCIYLLHPKGWHGEYAKGSGWNNGYNPNHFGYILAENNKFCEDKEITKSLNGDLETLRKKLYLDSKEGKLERQEIREEREEKKRKQKENVDTEIWRLEKSIRQYHLSPNPLRQLGIVRHFDKYDNFGFIVNENGEEFYFKVGETFEKSSQIQRYSIMEYSPKNRADGRNYAVDLKVLMINAIPKESNSNQYRRFGREKQRIKKVMVVH